MVSRHPSWSWRCCTGDDNSPRGFWKIALVKSLISGRDERVRGAVLKVGSADSRESLLQ